MSVIQVTSKEFKERQAALLDKVIIRRGKEKTYLLTPFREKDCWLTPELEKRIELSREQYKAGNVIVCNTVEEIRQFLDSL